jgi:hypothetical protein
MPAAVAVAVAAVIGFSTALTATQAAFAESQRLEERQRVGVVSWNTPRTNSKNPSAVTWRLEQHVPGTGAPFVVGLRNASGTQFARAEMNTGVTAPLRLDNGSTQIPRGTFYLNTRVQGACGGDGCGEIHWIGTLNWNL